jgi:hypothetical protein
VTLDEIEEGLGAAVALLEHDKFLAHKLSHSFFAFLFGRKLVALSDDVNGVTSSLSQLQAQFPAAQSSALSTAFSAGEAAAPSADPSLSSAVSNLVSQNSSTLSTIQSSLTGA